VADLGEGDGGKKEESQKDEKPAGQAKKKKRKRKKKTRAPHSSRSGYRSPLSSRSGSATAQAVLPTLITTLVNSLRLMVTGKVII